MYYLHALLKHAIQVPRSDAPFRFAIQMGHLDVPFRCVTPLVNNTVTGAAEEQCEPQICKQVRVFIG